MASEQHGTTLRHVYTLFNAGVMGNRTDRQLLERFTTRNGEAAELAFAELVERHGGMVFRVCRRILRDPHDARDAFQATFLVLVRRADSLWVRDSLGPWLHQVARRTALCARAASNRRRRCERKAAKTATQSVEGIEPDDLGEVLHEELDQLPARYRTAVSLCLLEGLTHEQAAHRLGWPIGTLQSRLARGRKQLRSRLSRRGLAPSVGLLGGGLSWETTPAAIPSSLAGATVQAASQFATGRSTAGSTAVVKLAERVLEMMFLAKLKIGAAALLGAFCIIVVASELTPRSVGDNGQNTPIDQRRPTPDANEVHSPLLGNEPGLAPLSRESSRVGLEEPNTHLPADLGVPRPWETTVRIKVHDKKSVGFGSGTVISSTPQESIILTCAHIFKLMGDQQVLPPQIPCRIMVDLFDGKLGIGGKAQVRATNEMLNAEAIDFDFVRDIGLIRIRPGRVLPFSPLVSPDWVPKAGMRMTTVGCSEGRDATAWATTIVNPNMRSLTGNATYEALECTSAPKQGRSGGGLFTSEGFVAGVCNFGEPQNNRGFYAHPRSIRHFLNRAGLVIFDRGERRDDADVSIAGRKNLGASRALSDSERLRNVERRLDEVEHTLDRILKALKGSKDD